MGKYDGIMKHTIVDMSTIVEGQELWVFLNSKKLVDYIKPRGKYASLAKYLKNADHENKKAQVIYQLYKRLVDAGFKELSCETYEQYSNSDDSDTETCATFTNDATDERISDILGDDEPDDYIAVVKFDPASKEGLTRDMPVADAAAEIVRLLGLRAGEDKEEDDDED